MKAGTLRVLGHKKHSAGCVLLGSFSSQSCFSLVVVIKFQGNHLRASEVAWGKGARGEVVVKAWRGSSAETSRSW